MIFQNSQLILMLVLVLTVSKIYSSRQYHSPTKRNLKFDTTANRRYRKLDNQEASIDVGNVISIVIPNNPHEMLNVEQLTEDFRSELERIKKQSSVNKFQHGLTTLRKVLPELSPEEKRKALPWLRRILKMKKLDKKYLTSKSRRNQDSVNDKIDKTDNEDFAKEEQQVKKRNDKSMNADNTERNRESDELDSEESEVPVTNIPKEEVQTYSITPIVTEPSTARTYVTQDYNSPPMSNFVTPADYVRSHNFPSVSALKNDRPVGLFKGLNLPLYGRMHKRYKIIPKEGRIPKSTMPNENHEIVAERDAAKEANFNRNARLVNDLARIAEQLANFRTNENPPSGYLDKLMPSARNDFAAAVQPLNLSSSEDLQSNGSVVTNEPKKLPEISADLIVYDYMPNKNTNDKRNNFYLPS